jgi:threonine synthase
MVSDDEIVAAYRTLAETEGLFVEPASAAGIAGLLKLGAAARLDGVRLAVATVTGHGLKDPERAVAVSPAVTTIGDDEGALRRLILE